MPTKLKVIRDSKSNKYCGPAALSVITGKHVDTCVEIFRKNRQYTTRIRGINQYEMHRALNQCGYNLFHVHTNSTPTLAGFLRLMNGRTSNQIFLIVITGHYIVLKGRKIYDNHNHAGVFIRQYNHRRKRVRSAWEIIAQEKPNARKSVTRGVESTTSV